MRNGLKTTTVLCALIVGTVGGMSKVNANTIYLSCTGDARGAETLCTAVSDVIRANDTSANIIKNGQPAAGASGTVIVMELVGKARPDHVAAKVIWWDASNANAERHETPVISTDVMDGTFTPAIWKRLASTLLKQAELPF